MSGDMNYKSNFVSYVLADAIISVNEVPFISRHYINVDEVSWITLKKLLQSAPHFVTNCDSLVYYKVTVITNCDSFFITKGDMVYYKLRQFVIIVALCNTCDSTIYILLSYFLLILERRIFKSFILRKDGT